MVELTPAEHVATRLVQALNDVTNASATPKVIVLYGETGRGKTYAVQRFYDYLAASRPGSWLPGLTPVWPPTSTRQVRRDRKRIEPLPDQWDPDGAPSFYWVGVGASPAEGAVQVDMSTVLAQQVRNQLAGSLAHAERRKHIAGEVLKITMDAIAALVPVFGTAKTIAEHARQLVSLAKQEGDPRVGERRALYRAFSAASRLHDQPVPLVVAIDDAQSAGFETLYLASGLIAEDTGAAPDAGGGRYLPPILDTVVPAPLLFVCTAWEHRLISGFDDPFQAWLRELDGLGVDIEWIPCSDISIETAQQLLHEWDRESVAATTEQILEHIVQPTADGAVVNPLVLAECVGQLEEERNSFTGQLVIDARSIRRLPVSPDQHIRDRLARLRDEPGGGQDAFALISIAAGYAAEFPDQLLTSLVGPLNDSSGRAVRAAIALLQGHSLIASTSVSSPPTSQLALLRSHRIDPDVFRYLSRQELPTALAAPLREGARLLMHWCCSDLMRDETQRFPIASYDVFEFMLAPAARLVLLAIDGGDMNDPDAGLIAMAIAGDAATGVNSHLCSIPALGFAYSRRFLPDLADEQIVAAARHYGGSRVTAILARRRLLQRRSAADAMWESLIDILKKHATFYATGATLADLLTARGRTDEAIDVLLPLARRRDLAMKVAGLLAAQGRADEAIDVLRPVAHNQDEVNKLAGLLAAQGRTDEAIDVLRPLAVTKARSASKLAGMLAAQGRTDEAIDLLGPLAGTFPHAATKLASLLAEQGRDDEAMATLRSFVGTDLHAATALAGLLAAHDRVDEAIEMLRPLTARFDFAILEIAALLLGQDRINEALDLLQAHPHLFRHPRTAGLHSAALLLAGSRSAAMEELRNRRSRRPFAFHAACSVLANIGRADLLGMIVEEDFGALMDRTVAGYMLVLAVKSRMLGGLGSLPTVVGDVWMSPQLRYQAKRSLSGALLAWTNGGGHIDPPLSPPQVLSCLEVVLALGRADGLEQKVVAGLVKMATESPQTRAEIEAFVEVSPVAATVIARSRPSSDPTQASSK